MHAYLDRQALLAATDPSGRQPTDQAGRYGAMTAEVSAFLARLRRTPADAWFRQASADEHIVAKLRAGTAAASLAERRAEPREDRLARARLRTIMDSMPIVARRVRRRIDEELGVLDGIATVGTLTQMRRAARLAACAVAARRLLTDDEFDRLYRPFATLIPPEELASR
jgi:hypothetical protein